MRVVVVGAGAAGIFAAWRAAQCGAEVILLEKTLRLGTKILISGGGKCNITHDGPIEDLIRAFRPHEGRFIRPSVYRFRNDQVVEMLTSRGLRVYTRPDGRIFPSHGNAKDVVAILRGYLEEAGGGLRFGVPSVRRAATRPRGGSKRMRWSSRRAGPPIRMRAPPETPGRGSDPWGTRWSRCVPRWRPCICGPTITTPS